MIELLVDTVFMTALLSSTALGYYYYINGDVELCLGRNMNTVSGSVVSINILLSGYFSYYMYKKYTNA